VRRPNPEDKSFCGECGARLAWRCPSCDAANPPGKKFCGDCGANLSATATQPTEGASPRAPEAERRQLTVMFVDLVGSTALSSRLDPEDLREVMRRYQDAVAGAVTRYGGHVAKYLGDGVLAYFGWPRAHEDQAERAVRAGLDAVAVVSGLKLDGDIELNARAGIATGEVVIGDLVGEAGAVSGETPNLAARLQEVAEAGQVVIGAATRQLIAGAFELDGLGARALKGFAETIPVWRVVGERGVESRFEAAHGASLTPFVGREHEIGLLLDRWQQAKGGEGQVVLLSGEAGIGKSRITQTLRERIAEEPHIRLRHQCAPYYASTALHPFIRQLELAAGFAPDDSAGTRLDKIETLLTGPAETRVEVAPLFAALLSVPAGDRYPPLELAPQRLKEKTLEALCDQVVALAARRPVLIIFEDVHWADPTTQEALELTIDRIQNAPLLVVITSRPEFTPPWHGYAHVTALALNRLGGEHCASIVANVTGGKALPEEVLDQIIAKTDGVPLFVEELTKTMVESGILQEKDDRYELTGPLPPLAIPSTLQDSLMARLDRLASVKAVAQIGAAIGREFSHQLLAEVSPARDSELDDALEQLVASELVYRRGRAPDAKYVFKHALVQDAAYGSLLKSRRQELHRKIATALQEVFPATAETEPEILAHHYGEANLTKSAIDHWQRAGRRASECSANAEAVASFERGLALLDRLSEGPERDRLELDLKLGLGPALISIVGYAAPEVADLYIRARELCERVGDEAQLFPVLYGLWVNRQQSGQLETARMIAAEALDLAEQRADTEYLLQAHHCAWTTFYSLSDLRSCRRHAEEGTTLYDMEQHRHHAFLYGGHDAGVCGQMHLAWTSWFLGRVDESVAHAETAKAMAGELDHPFTMVQGFFCSSLVHVFRREREMVKAEADVVAALTAEHRVAPHYRAAAEILRGWALVARTRPEDSIGRIRQGISDWRATGAGIRLSLFLALLAEVHRDSGQFDAGLEVLDEALALVEPSGERKWEPEIHRLARELRLLRDPGDTAEAEAAFGRAVEVAHGLPARTLELRAATSLARLWRDQGKVAKARDLLAPVYGWFTEGVDTPDFKEAKALLSELG
jgi:class 3 adenylate cyclase/predicted ATPase